MEGRVYRLLSFAVDAIAELRESPLVATHGELHELVSCGIQAALEVALGIPRNRPLNGVTPPAVLLYGVLIAWLAAALEVSHPLTNLNHC